MKSEAQIQYEIVKELQRRGLFFHSVPNEGAGYSRNRTMQLIATGLRPGVADLVLWWETPEGVHVAYLEVKTMKGRLSDAQKRFRLRCERSGVPFYLLRDKIELEAVVVDLEARYGKSR